MSDHLLTAVEQLEAIYGTASPRAILKEVPRLNAPYRAFIEHAPFMVLATAGPEGLDCSPRGDAPGFIRIVDDRTLALPDRPGNNRIDSTRNIVANPHVGLIFFVPGVNETLRVNGRARLTTDAGLLAPLAAHGKTPKAGILVAVDEAFLHCGKALIRAKLWEPESRIERARLPSLGKMIADQIAGVSVEEADRRVEESYVKRLY